MQLDYLDFDFSDEEDGRGSFDAMASVTAERLPALRAEIDAVIAWAGSVFGPNAENGENGDEGEWDYEMSETVEADAESRTTVTFTLSGSPAFCDAFRDKFELPG